MIHRFIAAGLLALAVLLAPGLAALAQTAPAAPATTVDFMPGIVNLVMPAVSILLVGIVAWALRKYLGIQLASNDAVIVNDALQKGLAFATSRLQTIPLKVDVKSPVIADAANYALAHAPDALGRLGVSPEQLAEKLVARYFDPDVPVGIVTPKPVEAASG